MVANRMRKSYLDSCEERFLQIGKLGKIRKFLERGTTVIYHMLARMLNVLTRSGRFFFLVICTPNLGPIPNRRLCATDGLVARRIGSLCRRHCLHSFVHQRMNLYSGVFLQIILRLPKQIDLREPDEGIYHSSP